MKTTKRALFSSVMALILCFSMLVGTTFAWFTDEVKSDVNKIVAGNLDVDVVTTADDKSIENQSVLFDEIKLWEPGVVAYENITVKNLGTLALKYQLSVNFDKENYVIEADGTVTDNCLADVLMVSVIEETIDAALSRKEVLTKAGEGVLLSELVKSGELESLKNQNYAIIIWWPQSANDDTFNINNGKTTTDGEALHINLGIKLLATQLAAEEDSFGKDYDNGAFIPVAPEALPENGDDLVLYGSAESKTTVTVPAAVAEALKETGVTSLSVEVSAPVVDTNTNTVTYTTVELVDQKGDEVDLSNSTAKLTVKLYVGDLFAQGEQVEVYHDGAFVTYATVDANGYIAYEVSHFCEVSVKVAEEVVLDNTIDSVKEFMAFAAAVNAGNSYKDQTVVLGADLDLAGVTWTPIGTSSNPFKGTFDGNGKVIKNLSVLMAGKSNVGLFGVTTDGEIKNVTVENAKVAGRLNVGVVAGTPYTSKYTNITVKGHVEVDGMAYVGGVGGKNAYANWNNVTVNVDATSYVNANSVENGTAYRTYVGGVVGFNGEGGHSFTNITSNINVFGSTCDVGGAFGIAHYGNKFENVTVSGNVEIYAAEDATEAEEMGGIAGVWHNADGYTVTFTNCAFTGKLTANVSANLSNNTIVGAPYNVGTKGKLVVDGNEVAASAQTLQALLNAATGDATIKLFSDIRGDVIVTQKEGVNVVIDGNGYKYDGTIYIYGQARHDGDETLTIKNINFITKGAKDFISSNSTDSDKRYAHNVTVENCTFTGAEGFGSVGMRYRQAFNMSVVNCTGTNLHSLIQATGGNSITVTGSTLNGCKNGMSFGTTENVTVKNNTINSVGEYGYGIRVDASGAYEATITGNTISADVCVLLRKATGAYTATLTGNTLKADVHAIMATSADYEEGKGYPAATGALNVTVDGSELVCTADQLVAALEAKNDVVFGNDIKIEPAKMSNAYGKTGINVKNGQTIDGNGYTLNIQGAGGTWDSGINTTGGLIKNLTVTGSFRGIFINHTSEYSEKVVLENVTIGGNGTVYTISCDQGLYQGIEATNCTFNGWTSFAKTAGEAKFVNCSFGEGSGYAYCRPYSDTEFVNCTFSEGYAVDTTRATVTFTNCANPNE